VSGRASAGSGFRGEATVAQDKGRARGPLIKRWIGMARRRADRRHPGAIGESAQIITLTWEQTFGRPPRMAGTEPGATIEAVVLPLRSCA
jgi:hypothetical protein